MLPGRPEPIKDDNFRVNRSEWPSREAFIEAAQARAKQDRVELRVTSTKTKHDDSGKAIPGRVSVYLYFP